MPADTVWKGLLSTVNWYTAGNYRGMNLPGVELACRGKVTKKYVEYGQHLVECNIWVETPGGDKTVSGKAVVKLPSRDGG